MRFTFPPPPAIDTAGCPPLKVDNEVKPECILNGFANMSSIREKLKKGDITLDG